MYSRALLPLFPSSMLASLRSPLKFRPLFLPEILRQAVRDLQAIITLYRTEFAPAQKPYRTGLLFAHKNGDFGAVSVTSEAVSRRSLKWKVTYRISFRTAPDTLSLRHEKLSVIV